MNTSRQSEVLAKLRPLTERINARDTLFADGSREQELAKVIANSLMALMSDQDATPVDKILDNLERAADEIEPLLEEK